MLNSLLIYLHENVSFLYHLIKVLSKPFLSILEFFIRNDFLYPIRKKYAKDISPKIAVIYMLDYFHHYLDGAIRDKNIFVLRHSRYFPRNNLRIPLFNPWDLGTMDVVLPETTNFLIEGFSKRHRILMRIQHSPGFSMKDPISPYPLIKKLGGKLMISKEVWDLTLQTDFLDDETRKLRRMILEDGIPLYFTRYDPKINKIYNCPSRIKRRLNSVLIAVNWKIFKAPKDIKMLIDSIRFLNNQKMKIAVRFHPLVNVFLKPAVFEFRQQLRGMDIKIMFSESSTIQSLVDLYDEYEFIVTDGSGSVYEAISRGCKALTLGGLSIQNEKGNFFPIVKLGLLPKTSFWDYRSHPGHSADMSLLVKLHGQSLIKEDVSCFIAREIINVFKNWNTINHFDAD